MSDYIEVLYETDPGSILNGDTLIHTDKKTYEESPRGAANGFTRCNFFRLKTSLQSLFLVQMG